MGWPAPLPPGSATAALFRAPRKRKLVLTLLVLRSSVLFDIARIQTAWPMLKPPPPKKILVSIAVMEIERRGERLKYTNNTRQTPIASVPSGFK